MKAKDVFNEMLKVLNANGDCLSEDNQEWGMFYKGYSSFYVNGKTPLVIETLAAEFNDYDQYEQGEADVGGDADIRYILLSVDKSKTMSHFSVEVLNIENKWVLKTSDRTFNDFKKFLLVMKMYDYKLTDECAQALGWKE